MFFSKYFLVCLYFIILIFIEANTSLHLSDRFDELFDNVSLESANTLIKDDSTYGDINEKSIILY